MALDASLLNTQHHKVRMKGKVRPPVQFGVAAIEKGSLRVALDYSRQLYLCRGGQIVI